MTCRTTNCDVRSDQDTEFNIKRRCCKVCWDEACDIDDGRKIMTKWNTEDIEAAKLKGHVNSKAKKGRQVLVVRLVENSQSTCLSE